MSNAEDLWWEISAPLPPRWERNLPGYRQPRVEWMRRTKVDKRCGRSHDNAIATTGHRLPLAHF